MTLAVGSAWAANADVTVTVTAVPTTVTLSRTDLKNYGAIQVTVAPTQNNVINRLVFASTAKIVLADASTVAAQFKESIPALACLPNAAGDTVSCAVDQARGGNVLSYTLVYEAPTVGASFRYEWTFTYSQAGSPGSSSSNIAASGTATATLTEATSLTQRKSLKTFVPAAGGKFFTGTGTATSPTTGDAGDPSTTTLSIPANLGLTQAATVIEDDGVPGGQTNDTLTTNTTTITIPSSGFFNVAGVPAPITAVLQRDQSTIRTGTQNAADRVPLYYTSDLGEPVQFLNQALPNCSDVSGPSATWPVCVDQRIYVKKNMLGSTKPGGATYGSLDLGDFVFVIKALQNGKTSW